MMTVYFHFWVNCPFKCIAQRNNGDSSRFTCSLLYRPNWTSMNFIVWCLSRYWANTFKQNTMLVNQYCLSNKAG